MSEHRDLDPAIFRKGAHETVEWIAEYLENMNRYPVLARTKPGEIKSKLPKAPPDLNRYTA